MEIGVEDLASTGFSEYAPPPSTLEKRMERESRTLFSGSLEVPGNKHNTQHRTTQQQKLDPCPEGRCDGRRETRIRCKSCYPGRRLFRSSGAPDGFVCAILVPFRLFPPHPPFGCPAVSCACWRAFTSNSQLRSTKAADTACAGQIFPQGTHRFQTLSTSLPTASPSSLSPLIRAFLLT